MLEGQDSAAEQYREVLVNIPVKIPSLQSFLDCDFTEDIYLAFRDDLEVVAQQMSQKFLVQLLDAATEGAGMVAEPVIKAAVNVDKALNSFVRIQEEHAQRDRQREDKPNGRKHNRNRSGSKRRKRRNRSRR